MGLPEADCRAIAAAALALAEVRPGDRHDLVLEIGAGTGTIGRWFLDAPARYVGLDLSRGMLEVFRHLPGSAGAGLVQADGARPWPLPDGAARLVFSSRAIHLLPLEHVVSEVLRVLAKEGGALVLGWIERPPENVKARMSKQMRQLMRARGFSPRTSGSRRLLEAFRERGATELPRRAIVRWPVRPSPRESLERWRGKIGLGGSVLPTGMQEQVLGDLEAWAAATFGDLDRMQASEEAYVLEGVRLPGERD
ncbi:MAG TPA: class I SAM-dependent methyltransferase [Thermoanaerobaculia bacterium]|nr:class I SAM-dependent methyltransferase [Thermoanaerobaculia bacterium]